IDCHQAVCSTDLVFLFSAFSIMAVTMPALFGIGASLAMEREMGLLRLKRAQPAPAGSWLVAKIGCGLGFAVLAYLPILTLALAAGHLPLQAGPLLAMSACLVASAIPFCALGLLIGTLFRGSSAAGYANLVYLPGCYLSGMFFPLPASMHWQVPLWPQFHVNQLAMHAAGVEKFQFEPPAMALAYLAGFTVLTSGIAIWRLARSCLAVRRAGRGRANRRALAADCKNPSAAEQRPHLRRIGALDHAQLGHHRVDQLGRGDVEHRVPGGNALGDGAHAAEAVQFTRVALLDLDLRAVGRVQEIGRAHV